MQWGSEIEPDAFPIKLFTPCGLNIEKTGVRSSFVLDQEDNFVELVVLRGNQLRCLSNVRTV